MVERTAALTNLSRAKNNGRDLSIANRGRDIYCSAVYTTTLQAYKNLSPQYSPRLTPAGAFLFRRGSARRPTLYLASFTEASSAGSGSYS